MHPTMIPAASPLAAVSGVFNAIFLTGDAVGDLMFYGRGAGQMPTASAVWSDVLEIARRVAHGIPSLALDLPSVGPQPLPLTPMDAIRCCYYLRVMAHDRPGVLSRVAGILGDNDISIANVIQKGRGTREAVPMVMVTHEARERDMRAALAAIDALPDVRHGHHDDPRGGWAGVRASEGGFAPLPTVVARLAARSSCLPPDQQQDCAGEAGARTRSIIAVR